jgi:hypothetical protein
MQSTNIVYVCSPDWSDQLIVSLYSLLRSGTTFDKVIVFCVGTPPRNWVFRDPRVEIREKASRPEAAILVEGSFYVNKAYVCESESERTVFLDADTVVRRPIDLIWSRSNADVIARLTARVFEPTWSKSLWDDVQTKVGGTPGYPYFNSGCVVFQNGAHRKLEKTWPDLISSLGRGMPVFANALHEKGTRLTEQLALSLAMGVHNLPYSLMSPDDHTYLWCGEDYRNSIVLHTSGPRFLGFIGSMGLSVDMASKALLQTV